MTPIFRVDDEYRGRKMEAVSYLHVDAENRGRILPRNMGNNLQDFPASYHRSQ
jgi:hypothetical protein